MLGEHTLGRWIQQFWLFTIVPPLAILPGCVSEDSAEQHQGTDSEGEELVDTDRGPEKETKCDDQLDNDQDGYFDCEDIDCTYVPAVDGACMNEQDLTAISAVDYNLAWNECVVYQGCMWDVDCNTSCFEETVQVTTGCARCFAELVECWITSCGSVCQNGGVSEECQICASENCRPGYGECIGQLVCKFEFACLDTTDNDDDGLVDLEDPDCQ